MDEHLQYYLPNNLMEEEGELETGGGVQWKSQVKDVEAFRAIYFLWNGAVKSPLINCDKNPWNNDDQDLQPEFVYNGFFHGHYSAQGMSEEAGGMSPIPAGTPISRICIFPNGTAKPPLVNYDNEWQYEHDWQSETVKFFDGHCAARGMSEEGGVMTPISPRTPSLPGSPELSATSSSRPMVEEASTGRSPPRNNRSRRARNGNARGESGHHTTSRSNHAAHSQGTVHATNGQYGKEGIENTKRPGSVSPKRYSDTNNNNDLKRKESPKNKKKSKKAGGNKDSAGSSPEISTKAQKCPEMAREVEKLRDLEQEELIAEFASKADEERQKWWTTLDNTKKSHAKSFERNGHGRARKDHASANTNHATAKGSKTKKSSSSEAYRWGICRRYQEKSWSGGAQVLSKFGAIFEWIRQMFLLIMVPVVHNVGFALGTLIQWHLHALAGVFLNLHVFACFGFLYFLPSFLNSVDAGIVPTWMMSCLWYLFLVQIFFSGSSNRLLGFAQTVLPFTLLTSSYKAEEVIVQMNGGERLLVAYFLSSLKTGTFNQSMTYISLGVQLAMTTVFGRVAVVHWILFLIGSGTIYSPSETKRKVCHLKASIPSLGFDFWPSVLTRSRNTSSPGDTVI